MPICICSTRWRGGAGYADQAADSLETILDATMEALRCPAGCDRSCHECLRNYTNRYQHEHLDRHLAAALLVYVRDGSLPGTTDLAMQRERLLPLKRMLELDGLACDDDASRGGMAIPLLVSSGGTQLALGTYNGVLDPDARTFHHPLRALDGAYGPRALLLNGYLVERNLPAAYELVKRALR